MTIDQTIHALERGEGSIPSDALNSLLRQCREWQLMEKWISVRVDNGEGNFFEEASAAITSMRRMRVEHAQELRQLHEVLRVNGLCGESIDRRCLACTFLAAL